jgi:hypothetical protein
VRDGQPSPHRPRLVVSPSTCPPISPPPPRKQLCTRSCSNKHTPAMVRGHPSRSALSTPPIRSITSSRISAQPTTRHRLRGDRRGEARRRVGRRRGRLTSSARQSLRALVMQSSAPAPGAQSTWDSALGYRGQHLTVPISTNDLHY